ncbi:LysR family transcriptional regulator [Photobacterium jeanii]|uniref:LysR family transcriptional regulator n=1 Tax=Photobacterium jeanii TaxID=858640 RepID=A0A178K1Z2_9GAMM|nr:LysR family transcriptional regulator [Photobacterium jeanii]OAN10965.1 LysR family transcriptional regulator [Photobacterium jeanii]PST90480.1 LysR family transcriptional regulator [Photobacterium jeanii]
MYSFEQLKIFVTVCECGSFSAAARKLKRAQSGVSQSIANLEIAIDQELFNREKNTPTLTKNGKALLPIAKSILHQQHYFDQKVESLEREDEHELVVAIEESLVNDELLSVFSGIAEQFPITHIDIVSASTFDIIAMVKSGDAQLGVIYTDGEFREDMDFVSLGYSRFITVTAPDHPLAALSSVKSHDLQEYRQIVHRSSQQQELWFSYGISSKTWYANSHQIMLQLAMKGLGWTVVPEQLAQASIAQGKLVALPIDFEPQGWLTSVGCLVSRSRPTGPVLESLLSSLQRNMDLQ